ncbi:MFS transporter, partial [Burkholderia multivorans]
AIAADFAVYAFTIAAAFAYGLAETLVDTALIATVPRTVDPGRLTAANSRLEATINVANQLAGPPLAGLLIGLSSLAAAASGAGLYAMSALAAVGLALTLQRGGNTGRGSSAE